MLRLVKDFMSKRLIDPASATYECSAPTKGWINPLSTEYIDGGKTYYGYLMECQINAKNRLGGYTGRQPYTFLMHPVNGGSAFAYINGYNEAGVAP